MTSSRLIGLYSSAPGSGKSTVADYLCLHGYRLLPCAESLKKMIRIYLLETGLTPAEVEHYMIRDKETPIRSTLGVSVRHLCQTLGTDWGRQCVHPDIWVSLWRRRVQDNLVRGIDVVADDVRFPNEADAVRRLGGELWLVDRPSVRHTTTHASEGGLDMFPFDRRIVNGGSLVQLYGAVKLHLDKIQPAQLSA